MIVVVRQRDVHCREHGGLYQNLKALRDSDGKAECNFFRALGLDYLYVRDGNDVAALIEVFNRVKTHPVRR